MGLLYLNGSNNSVISNHISETIGRQYLKPPGTKPVIIHVAGGTGNYIANNHIVATTETEEKKKNDGDSCFAAQVGALLAVDRLEKMEVTAVLIDKESSQNVVLDTATEAQAVLDRSKNAFRPVPEI